MENLSVGQRVRVFYSHGVSSEDTTSKIGTIALLDGSEVTVFFDNGSSEDIVPVQHVEPLLDFELFDYPLSSFSPGDLKTQGNSLFGKKDFASAERRYRAALQGLDLSPENISVGTDVLIVPRITATMAIYECPRHGMVTDVDTQKNTCSVMIEAEDDDEVEVNLKDVVIISPDAELQRSLYLNLCRCSFKKKQAGWAVHWATLALSIASLIYHNSVSGNLSRSEMGKLVKAISDAYHLRGRSLLLGHRHKLARKDVQMLREMGDARALQLDTEIMEYLARKQKLDRKLAINVAKWVDTAMKISAEKSRAGSAGAGAAAAAGASVEEVDEGDIMIEGLDEDEDGPEGEAKGGESEKFSESKRERDFERRLNSKQSASEEKEASGDPSDTSDCVCS